MTSKGLYISADCTSENKLLSSRRVIDLQRTLSTVQRYRGRASRTLGKSCCVSQSSRIVVASVAEVGRPEAEEDGERAAVSAFVLHKLRSMMLTHLEIEIQDHINFQNNNMLSYIM